LQHKEWTKYFEKVQKKRNKEKLNAR